MLTHLDNLLPIPVAMEVIQSVVMMPSVLLRATGSLISFRPGGLDTFPTGASDARSVVK